MRQEEGRDFIASLKSASDATGAIVQVAMVVVVSFVQTDSGIDSSRACCSCGEAEVLMEVIVVCNAKVQTEGAIVWWG